jgi:hypothetical protein
VQAGPHEGLLSAVGHAYQQVCTWLLVVLH